MVRNRFLLWYYGSILGSNIYYLFTMKKSSVEYISPYFYAIFLAKVDFPEPGNPLNITNLLYLGFYYGSIKY